MRAKLEFGARAPAVAVIGTWDPLDETHHELFRKLARHARRSHLSSVAIILHPPPARLLSPSEPWPEYHDVRARIAMIRECGVDAVLVTRFAARDVDASARDFFRIIASHLTLREVWLGALQSLGRGPEGSAEAIAKIGRQRCFRVRRLPVTPASSNARSARELLLSGAVGEAAAIIGRPPVWGRPRSAILRLAWKPGDYLVAPLESAVAAPTSREAVRLRLSMPRSRGLSELCWPFNAAKWIAVLAGPADRWDPIAAQ